MRLNVSWLIAVLLGAGGAAGAAELHVATTGRDTDPGTAAAPVRTIQRAADLAWPGDTVTVHAGVYRERVNPPRGGADERRRIVYRAAPGEHVEIRGSEVVKGWTRVRGDVWETAVPNTLFGAFNPFADVIQGDWFDPRGREHHTGAVYLNGQWLAEATKREELDLPADSPPAWLAGAGRECLLNVAWLRAGTQGARAPATGYAAQAGVQNAPCEEGGDCIGWIEHGDWVRYDRVDFGAQSTAMELRVASATSGGTIQVRLDSPTGPLLGSCFVPNTGGWQSWRTVTARLKATAGVRRVCLAFVAGAAAPRPPALWFAEVGASATTIRAQFRGVDPNRELVEINVRRTVFYPDRPGRNYITVRGFALRQAATPWAPPTAEQIGVIGTHWSRGWVIEECAVSHSTCSGIALGKHGDRFDNTSANTAEGYVKTIERGLAMGWNRQTIGHHVVRNNRISHCEQAGIVGSLGAAFCTVTGNTIHDVHVRRYFSGAEMAGIKFHGAIDTVIAGNHIYRTCLGLWLDWMAQGTRVTRNLFHDNAGQDLFVEVDHGPFVVDNNLFLSPTSLLDVSEGGAYIHNLFAGGFISSPEPNRETPYHPAHSTTVAGLTTVKGGDNRFLNNLFVGSGDGGAQYGLAGYDTREYPLVTGGNMYVRGARPWAREVGAVALPTYDPAIRLRMSGERAVLELTAAPEMDGSGCVAVNAAILGRARVANLPYEAADGSPIAIDTDYLGRRRTPGRSAPGPFAVLTAGRNVVRVR